MLLTYAVDQILYWHRFNFFVQEIIVRSNQLLLNFFCSFFQGNGCLHCKHTYIYIEVCHILSLSHKNHLLAFAWMNFFLLLFKFDFTRKHGYIVSYTWIPFSGVVIADGVLQNRDHFERHGILFYLTSEISVLYFNVASWILVIPSPVFS
jgi:hypothetical protein